MVEVGTRVNGRGRPRTILDIVASARIAVGVHVDPSLITVVALDLGGEVRASASSTDVDVDDPRSAMVKIAAMVRRLIRDGSVDERQLVGACLALPGPVDPATGAPDSAVWLPGWAQKSYMNADIAKMILAYLRMNKAIIFDPSDRTNDLGEALRLVKEVIGTGEYPILPYREVLTNGFNTQ